MSGTKLRDADLTYTWPPALTHDPKMTASAAALAGALQEQAGLGAAVGFYYRIDELDETTLDMLADDLHVDWYDRDADLETKRAVIAGSVYVHRHMGTPAAVQRALEDSFGSGAVQEWFDYGGEAFHFRVSTENAEAVSANLQRFLTILEKAKRAAAVLDGVEIDQVSELNVRSGLAVKLSQFYTMRSDTAE